MKTVRSAAMNLNRWIGAVVLVVLLAGCATSKIDWAGRVGNYTYDQAITELGPPDREAKLSDGTIVADWITRRAYRNSFWRWRW